MARAKTLTDEALAKVLAKVDTMSGNPLRDYAAILLSFRGGLRACEIAGLSWRDVLDAEGKVADTIEIPPGIAKKGAGGTVPMHPAIKATLEAMRAKYPAHWLGAREPILRGVRQTRLTANYVQKRLGAIYGACGLIGVTSHSGRRSFLTALAQRANEYGCSLKDVQHLARHANIGTTEAYIDPSANVGKMVRAL